MKTLLAIIVYNRYDNLKRWLHCWSQCDKDAELIVIHTGEEIEKFESLCTENKVKYIHRQNIGFDIGSFQDVCRERLQGFPNNWDYLLWCTDDTIPMTKDFIKPFTTKMQEPGVGIACMEISKSVTPHVRTTGFCIAKSTTLRLQFPADPVTTKQQCYHFEHRGGVNILTNQVRAMGLSCQMVAPPKTSPLWDTGYWKRLDRQAEHDAVFNPDKKQGDKVTFICTIYNSYPQIISSLMFQTHENWELILIHDGPMSDSVRSHLAPQANGMWDGSDRVKIIETKERKGNYGHHLRQWALNEFELGEYTVVTNADNYYTPVFIEYMLKGFAKSHTAVATYCDKMIHSYKAWDVIGCKLERGYLDCGGVMIKSAIAKEVGWRDIESHSSDWTFFSDIAAKYSPRNFIPVKGALFVHN